MDEKDHVAALFAAELRRVFIDLQALQTVCLYAKRDGIDEHSCALCAPEADAMMRGRE